ncbi:MAG TPA: nucleotidyltransferase domain-containing protein [Methylococcaceae bacterium]|nr:nucleotidyltransferase domain-containing protein [Methylococcaceae bacterium]
MTEIKALKKILNDTSDLELAVLVGSRADETATSNSDWDIAIRWKKHIQGLERHDCSESLKLRIAEETGIDRDKIDLIDMTTARLAMKALIAEEGLILLGEDTLAWHHFLTLTWGELEDFYWRKQHAA